MIAPSHLPFAHQQAAHVLTGKRYVERIGEGHYEIGWPDLGVTCDLARLHRGRDEDLMGELTVTTTLPGAKVVEGVLSSAVMNFSSQLARTGRAGFLRERSGARDIDWVGLVETVCLLVIRAERAGEPIGPLADHALPGAREAWDVQGVPILRAHPMILFGDGGVGKSTIALYIALTLAQRGIRVLYCDWEFSAEDHRERLGRLCGLSMPRETLHYVRCAGPLVTEATRLQAHVAKAQIEYVICDSIGFAVAGRPEEAEHAGAYYRAVRGLGIGSLHLAHISKSLEHGEDKPFGSAFWANGARSLWFLKRSDDTEGPDIVNVALYHKKSNTSRRLPARGLRLTYSPAAITVARFDVADDDTLAATLPVWQRMQAALRHAALTEDALAEEVSAKPAAVRQVLRRSAHLFLRLVDGRIGLKAHDDDSF